MSGNGSPNVMSEKRRLSVPWQLRSAVFGAACALLLLLSGDRARTAVISGIDPLEILKLQVRPNVLVVLDSSGSMRETLTAPPITVGDDHPRAKMHQAKAALNQFIQDNQTRVSFQFGIYNSAGYNNPAGTKYNNANSELYMDPNDSTRFVYTSEDAAAASHQVNPGGSENSNGKIRRVDCVDLPDVPGEDCDDDGNDYTIMDIDGTIFYLVKSKRFFNGQTVFHTPTGGWCSTAAGTATNPPTVTLQEVDDCATPANQGTPVTFTFAGKAGDWRNPDSACDGFFNLVPLLPCNDLDQIATIGAYFNPSLLMSADGLTIQGYADSGDADGDSLDTGDFGLNGDHVTGQPTSNGIRAGGFTPIGNTFTDLKAIFNDMYNGGPLKPASLPTPIGSITPAALRPRTYVIFVTDGDDTCLPSGTSTTSDDGTTGTGNPANQRALHAAYKAQLLYQRINATDPSSGVESFVILFGSGASKDRGDWIAYGGSGMVRATTSFSTSSRWATIPSASDVAACSTCRPAFSASNASQLSDALQEAISFSAGQGEFSTAPTIVATVFELVNSPASAFDPDTRYSQRINILYQSTWDLPEWRGHLYAFRNDGTFLPAPGANSLGIWDAGQTLFDAVTVPLRTTPGDGAVVNQFTFAQLHGGATVADLSGAIIKRRIFTTSRNGVWPRPTSSDSYDNAYFDASDWASGSNVVALWPPNQAGLNGPETGITEIDPAVGTAGPLDAAMGIASLSYLEMQALGACDGQAGSIPAACDIAANATLATDTARKETRQIALAWIAGAKVKIAASDGKPMRSASDGSLLYQDRDWLMGDTVLSSVAVATPPLRFEPSQHISEFVLYRDGRRDADGQGVDEVELGFGLRNPDFDDENPESKTALKPVMTVVYHGANDMLYAFRAGPQCPPGFTGSCPGTQQGSEELYAFLPFDLLATPLAFVRSDGQVSSPHVYGIAAGMRLGTIFVPSQNGYILNGVTFHGRWRTVLFFGRGPGGKYLTAIDVTAPGTFTTPADKTNPPWVMWSRGNVDSQDGTVGGADNNNSTDRTAYAEMGQTWSIPAVGNVDPSLAVACDDGSQPEWRVWVGSGYGDDAVPAEGKRFYMLDALSGNVCRSWVFPNDPNSTPITHNAIVAGPAGYNPRAQDPPGATVKDTIDRVTRVYVPDLHGRIWRYSTVSNLPGVLFNAGIDQPFAHGPALLKVSGLPRVYIESGDDNRVPESEAPFRMYGLTDTLSETTFATPGTLATLIPSFTIDFPCPAAGGNAATGQTVACPLPGNPSVVPFRGTVQPATAFNDVSQPRVFYAGTRFNPAGSGGSCVSSFDTILFAVSGNTGGAVYDFSGDSTADLANLISGTRTTGISVVGGSAVVGDSGSLSNAPTPTPDPSPTPTPPPPMPAYVTQKNLKTNSPVCRTQ